MTRIKYADIRDLIKTGDRIEFAGKGVVGRLIRWFTKEPTNHTAIALDINEYSPETPGNRKFVLEADPDGIVLHTLSNDLKEADGDVFWTPLKPCFDPMRPLIADWALQRVGAKYDFGSLFKNAFARVNASMRKLFCSEYLFLSRVAAGIVVGVSLNAKGEAVDGAGKAVKAPRPGEMGECDGETIQLIL